MSKKTFKIGDHVRVVNYSDYWDGVTGVIVEVQNDGRFFPYHFKPDRDCNINGETLLSHYKERCGGWGGEHLEPIEATAKSITWGEPIPVNGVRPEWLRQSDICDLQTSYGWCDSERTEPSDFPIEQWHWTLGNGNPNIKAIRLPADHPYYLATSKGYTYWPGGKSAPEDIDTDADDAVLFHCGQTRKGYPGWHWGRSPKGLVEGDWHIIGYKKKVAEQPQQTSLTETQPLKASGVDWTKPIEAVEKATGRVVPMEYEGRFHDDMYETKEAPCSATSNTSWRSDGRDRCSLDKWFIRNVAEPKQEPEHDETLIEALRQAKRKRDALDRRYAHLREQVKSVTAELDAARKEVATALRAIEDATEVGDAA